MNIYVDMDGVLSAFVPHCLSWMEVNHLRESDIHGWAIEEYIGVTPEQLWSQIRCPEFWATMPPYPWCYDLMKLVSEFGRPVLLTSPAKAPGAAAGKMDWIFRHFGLDFTDWIFTNQKHYVTKPGDILIDDSDKNCEAWSLAGGRAITFPQYWNRHRSTRESSTGTQYLMACIRGALQMNTTHRQGEPNAD